MCTLGFENSYGQEQGMWLCGHVSFGLAVLIANIIVLMKSNIHNKYSLGIFGLMFAAFFVAFAFESNFLMFT